ncbi:MAG: hypothetical protein CBB97_02435 [Candidatus Endolissoclinum sp. TMED37]|nr:MAG: hypothetical protein CBB97_02435 [Candidatus Endolissoclinum sp. TMED37]|tara:strand:+ start:413 stop:622 length:210 start_codon:yes stop_codon:yes gene_type:complete
MTETVVKFPNSKRALTSDEEKLVRSCANLIHNTYYHGNSFVQPKQKAMFTETQIRTLLRKVFELNEDTI